MMITKGIELISGGARELFDVGEAALDYAVEEVSNIPNAIEKGWDEGLLTKTSEDLKNEPEKEETKVNSDEDTGFPPK